ncbi:MAG: hypothetical protein ACTHWA_05790 [Arachnia sp.]
MNPRTRRVIVTAVLVLVVVAVIVGTLLGGDVGAGKTVLSSAQ